MPAPSVTTHRVGKNAVVTIDGNVARHSGGNVNLGGGTDTQVYPDGYDRQASTNDNASGDLNLIVLYGETISYTRGQFINLNITDGTNTVYDGVAYINTLNQQFANDQGFGYAMGWLSHGNPAGGPG